MKLEVKLLGITIVILAATVGFSRAIDSRPEEPLAQSLDTIPMVVGGWEGQPDPPLRGDILGSLTPSSYLSRTYRRGQETINMFVVYYANQKAGESMHSPKHCLPGAGWEILSYGESDLPVADRSVRVNRDIIQKDGTRMAVLYWYQSRRRVIADEFRAKLYLIRDAMVDHRTGGSIVRIVFSADARSAAVGTEFASAIFPFVQRSLGASEAQE